MSTLILDRKVAVDTWTLVEEGAAMPATGDVIVPLATWQAESATLAARAGRTGVWLKSADDPAALANDLPRLGLVAVQFPAFTDGRGYSTARLLRTRLGYAGELRAIGDIQRDQLFYLSRVGFNAFALKDGQDAQAALAAFDDFTDAYQTSVAQPVPYYRRRLAA